jgi:hypothetical protein
MNISFSVLSPPVIEQASHDPSRAPGDESQRRSSPVQGAPTFPATHAMGWHWKPCGGTCEARVTVVGSGEPSAATPLLYSDQ